MSTIRTRTRVLRNVVREKLFVFFNPLKIFLNVKLCDPPPTTSNCPLSMFERLKRKREGNKKEREREYGVKKNKEVEPRRVLFRLFFVSIINTLFFLLILFFSFFLLLLFFFVFAFPFLLFLLVSSCSCYPTVTPRPGR